MNIISILPSDMQILYERMIDKIPYSRREEAFYMLKVVLRCKDQLDLYDFAITVACASHATIGSCLQEVAGTFHSPNSLSQINYRLRDRYGAFIEVVGFSVSPRVQFIH